MTDQGKGVAVFKCLVFLYRIVLIFCLIGVFLVELQ